MERKPQIATPLVFIALAGGVFVTSWSSIFIRWCGDTSPLIISFYRLFWATLILLFWESSPTTKWRLWLQLPHRARWLVVSAGTILALHFATWIASLQFTTVAQSLILESSHPIWGLLLSWWWLKEKPGWLSIIAVALGLTGMAISVSVDFSLSFRAFVGDLLAVASAVFVSVYLLIARHLRHALPLSAYLPAVYGSAAGVLLITVLIIRIPVVDYPITIHFWMFLLALGPTIMGHSLLNWAARHIRVYYVNFVMLGEPILATLLAYGFFRELPPASFIPGAILVVSGIVVALWEPLKTNTK